MSIKNLAKAVEFNDYRLKKGELTKEDIAYLIHFFQERLDLGRDGMAGVDETIPAIREYEKSLLVTPVNTNAPFANWVWPLAKLISPSKPDGVFPEISCEFGADRKHPITGLPLGHGGCDCMYRRAARGAVLKPDYLKDWYSPSDKENPILASWEGTVIIAGKGKAKNGQEVIEIVVDYGEVPGFGRLAFEYLHCKRLLVKRGAKVVRGQPIAIVGHTATDTTHLHFEVWVDLNKDGKITRVEKANPRPLLMQMKYATYRLESEVFDPTKLELPN